MEAKGIDFASIPKTAIRVVTAPAAFFREMPKEGGFVEPLVFMVVLGVVSGVLGGILQAINSILGLHLYAGMAMSKIVIVLMPVSYAIGSAVFGFVGAAILFVIWKLMGSEESYETAYRCNAYLAAVLPITTILGVIPYLGFALGLILMLFYLVTASSETHRIPAGRAWTVFGIITAVVVILTVSSQFAARRFARNMEQAADSWKDASREMQRRPSRCRSRCSRRWNGRSRCSRSRRPPPRAPRNND